MADTFAPLIFASESAGGSTRTAATTPWDFAAQVAARRAWDSPAKRCAQVAGERGIRVVVLDGGPSVMYPCHLMIEPLYKTALGGLYNADSLEVLPTIADQSVDLVFTSPPYALHSKKAYGNADSKDYVQWFMPFAREIKRILKPTGSFVLNIGGTWNQGSPTRSLYHFRLLLALCDELGFQLAQELFWYNPAKMPAPAEWVTVRRIRVKDSVEYLYWLALGPLPKANNRGVLHEYSPDMKKLIRRGLSKTKRPSGHVVKSTFSEDRGGSIPSNVLTCGNNTSNSAYIKRCKELGRKIHPARFPPELPRFFMDFLTEKDDLIVDPFAGSNTTGEVAELLERRWISIERDSDYAQDSRFRFADLTHQHRDSDTPPQPL